jgi:hypothetical protein
MRAYRPLSLSQYGNDLCGSGNRWLASGGIREFARRNSRRLCQNQRMNMKRTFPTRSLIVGLASAPFWYLIMVAEGRPPRIAASSVAMGIVVLIITMLVAKVRPFKAGLPKAPTRRAIMPAPRLIERLRRWRHAGEDSAVAIDSRRAGVAEAANSFATRHKTWSNSGMCALGRSTGTASAQSAPTAAARQSRFPLALRQSYPGDHGEVRTECGL